MNRIERFKFLPIYDIFQKKFSILSNAIEFE